MIPKIVITALGIFSLATCQNQKTSQNSTITPNSEIATNTSTKSTPVKTNNTGEPEMSVGLPPDRDAVKTAQEEQGSSSINKSGVVYLAEGENKFLKEYEMNVTFKRMVEDSRCPQGVNCVWEGVATAEIELMGLATRPMTVRISTMNSADRGYSKTQAFNGYNVSLVEVAPETTSAKGFNALKGKYKIGLRFEKGTPVDPKTQRGGTTTK